MLAYAHENHQLDYKLLQANLIFCLLLSPLEASAPQQVLIKCLLTGW